jgi:hypothetical protein
VLFSSNMSKFWKATLRAGILWWFMEIWPNKWGYEWESYAYIYIYVDR